MNEPSANPPDRPASNILRVVLEAAVVVVFALLIWNNYSLRQQVRRQARAAVPPVRTHAFVARDAIESVPTIDLSGKRGTLDLRTGRRLLAIVDPGCDSCRELVASLRAVPGLHVLSVASVEATRAMAGSLGLTSATTVLGSPLAKSIEVPIQIYPQLLIVDRGRVVRTCATFAECAR